MDVGQPLGLKSVRLTEFNGRTLTCDRENTVILDFVDQRLTEPLMKWYRTHKTSAPVCLTVVPQQTPLPLITIQQMNEEWREKQTGEGMARVVGTVSFIKKDDFESITYTGCKNANCKKKAQLTTGGIYYCEGCQRGSNECDYRYMINMKIEDSTGDFWGTAFDEVATSILGVSANQLKAMMDRGEPIDSLGEEMTVKEHEFKIKVRVQDTAMGLRVRMTIIGYKNIDGDILSEYFTTMRAL